MPGWPASLPSQRPLWSRHWCRKCAWSAVCYRQGLFSTHDMQVNRQHNFLMCETRITTQHYSCSLSATMKNRDSHIVSSELRWWAGLSFMFKEGAGERGTTSEKKKMRDLCDSTGPVECSLPSICPYFVLLCSSRWKVDWHVLLARSRHDSASSRRARELIYTLRN